MTKPARQMGRKSVIRTANLTIRVARGLILAVAVAFALSAFLHIVGAHDTNVNASESGAVYAITDSPSIPCESDNRHVDDNCLALGGCAICLMLGDTEATLIPPGIGAAIGWRPDIGPDHRAAPDMRPPRLIASA